MSTTDRYTGTQSRAIWGQGLVSLGVALGLAALLLCAVFFSGEPERGSNPYLHRTQNDNSKPYDESSAPPPLRLPSPAEEFLPKENATLGFQPGDRITYDFFQNRALKIQSSTPAEPMSSTDAPPSTDVTIMQRGQFIATVYAQEERGWTVGFRLSGARFESSSNETQGSAPSGDLSGEMTHELLTFVLKSGKIEKMVASPTISPEARNHWRDILSRWQVVLPDNAEQLRWTLTEEDATGTYVANYARSEPGAKCGILKKKDRYLSLLSPGAKADITSESLIHGQSSIHMDPYQKIIEGKEVFSVQAKEIGISVESEVVFKFDLRGVEQVSNVANAGTSKKMELANASQVLSWKGEPLPAADAGPVAIQLSRAQVEAELATLRDVLLRGGMGSVEHVQSMERLCSLIDRDDVAVEAILDALNEPFPNSDYASTLIGALGSSGTRSAQNALFAIANDPNWPSDNREMAFFSFAQVKEPIPEAYDWLEQIHAQGKEHASNALLLMAAMGDRIRENNPGLYENIKNYVLNSADMNAQTSDNDFLFVLLDAAGNLGFTDVPPFVHNAFTSEEDIIRNRAIQSLQRTFSNEATEMIYNAICEDSSDSVRISAAKLLANTNRPGAVDVLINVLNNDTSEGVRTESLMSLEAWLDKNPGVEAAIKQTSDRDSSKKVRDMARQLLQSHSVARL